MFTSTAHPATQQICGVNPCFLPFAPAATRLPQKPPTQVAQHSLFSKGNKKYHLRAIVAEPSLDAELHIKTTTIMFADVVESVRLIEQDELGAVTRIRALLSHIRVSVVPQYGGALLERRGDGLLLTFPDAPRAAACALAIHRSVELANTDSAATA